jgi:hypothetical protein
MDILNSPTFRPVQNPRSTEFTLWALTILVWAAWIFLRSAGGFILVLTPVVALVLALLAFGLSLSNFIERRSELTLSPEGIAFKNGLRNTLFGWREIEEVRILPAALGSKTVHVVGPESRFMFKTLAVASHKDKELGRSGFSEGERIVETIIGHAGLSRRDASDSAVYYARK